MGRLLVAVDPSIGVGAAAFAEVWNGDESAARWGPARVESGRGEVMVSGLVWVVVPVAVGLVTSALYDVVKRLVVRAAPKVDRRWRWSRSPRRTGPVPAAERGSRVRHGLLLLGARSPDDDSVPHVPTESAPANRASAVISVILSS